MEHQEARLDAFIRSRWGNNCEVTCYKRVAGGLDLNNAVFLRLIDDILAQKFAGGFVVCQDPSRLARMAHALLEHIAKLGRTEIVYLMDEETAQKKTDNEELADELLMIITSYTARASGRKAKEFLQIRVQPPVINRIFELQRIGYSNRTIATILEREGQGQAENGKITRHVVNRILRDKSLAKVARKDDSPAVSLHSFGKFVAAPLRLSSPETTVSFKRLQACYLEWCQLNGETPITSQRTLAHYLRCHFGEAVQFALDSRGSRIYRGLSILSQDAR